MLRLPGGPRAAHAAGAPVQRRVLAQARRGPAVHERRHAPGPPRQRDGRAGVPHGHTLRRTARLRHGGRAPGGPRGRGGASVRAGRGTAGGGGHRGAGPGGGASHRATGGARRHRLRHPRGEGPPGREGRAHGGGGPPQDARDEPGGGGHAHRERERRADAGGRGRAGGVPRARAAFPGGARADHTGSCGAGARSRRARGPRGRGRSVCHPAGA